MAESLLKKQFSKIKSDPSTKPSITALIQSLSSKVFHKCKSKFTTRGIDVNDLITKSLKKLDPADVELNLRRAKLREAKRAKRELEAKLVHIKESIDNFSTIDELAKIKPSLQDSQIRQEYFEEQKQKTKEVKKKVKEYRQEQVKRQEKIEKYIKTLEMQIEHDREKKQKQIEEIETAKKKNYEKYLRKLQEKARMRRKELQESKVLALAQGQKKHEKPLYVKLSEQFWKEVEMPELEKRKEELKKKRIVSSVSSQQLLDHAKWYETVRQEHKKKLEKEMQSMSIDRKVKSSESTFTTWQQKIKNQEKVLKQEKQKGLNDMLKKIDKRSQYSSLVRQMYPPSIDSAKSKEVEMRKLKFAASVSIIKKEIPQTITETKEWKPHKFNPNPLAPKKEEQKKPKEIIDYLRKIREDREKDVEEGKSDKNDLKLDSNDLENLSEDQKIKILKKKAKKLEDELRKKEIKYAKTPINIKESDDINDMLISSIKTKLAILEKNKD